MYYSSSAACTQRAFPRLFRETAINSGSKSYAAATAQQGKQQIDRAVPYIAKWYIYEVFLP